MKTLAVGRFRLYLLDDGTWRFPAQRFFHDVPEAVWRQDIEADAEGRIPVGHNCALLEADRDLIVIDTGYGDDTHAGCTGHLRAEFALTGFHRDEVTHVVLTHAHGDHIKGNTEIVDGRRCAVFPNARYHLARADWTWFHGPRGEMHAFSAHIETLATLGVLVLDDGETELVAGVRLVPTPGHTPGHRSVLMMSDNRSAIFLGDVCHHPLHFAHPDWVSDFDTDPALTPATRKQLCALAVAREAWLVCPHAPSPGLGRVQQTQEGYQWQAVT